MFEIIEELVELIKKENRYLKFMQVNETLKNENIYYLLLEYKDKKDQYIENKKYEKYIDISDIKQEYQEIKKKLSECHEINEYYETYYELNDLLEDITKIIFEGISDELTIERY